MEKERRVKALAIVVLVIAVLGLTIAFAALSQTLTINGNARINASTWDVHFDNMKLKDEVGKGKNVSFGINPDDNTKASLSVNLKQPKDSVEYTIDIVNDGDINAIIDTVKVTDTKDIPYLDFKAVYADGDDIEKDQILNKGDSKGVIFTVIYKDVENSDLVKEKTTLDLEVELVYKQTDYNSGETVMPKESELGNALYTWDVSRDKNVGDNVTMTYYDSGILTFTGTGEMENKYSDDAFPICKELLDQTLVNDDNYDWKLGAPMLYDVNSVYIDNGITNIPAYAYAFLPNLTKVKIPNSVINIEEGAFYQCLKLPKIIIPDSVTVINDEVFSNCEKLSYVKLPKNLISIGNNAFMRCVSLETINIPNSVTKIGYNSFYYCSNLVKINLPTVINEIGSSAFAYCKKLENIEIPEGITKIEYSTFFGCENLKTLIIPESVSKIGNRAIANCKSLKELTMPASAIILNNSFESTTNIEKITYTKGTGKMQDFTSNSNDKVKVIYTAAPAYLSREKLKEVVLEEGITSIGDFIIYECKNVKKIVIPSTVKRIGYDSFYRLGISKLVIPSGVAGIYENAFYNCENLSEVFLPSSLTHVGFHAFSYMKKESTIYLENEDLKELLKDGPFGNEKYSHGYLSGERTVLVVDPSKFN